MKIEPDTNADGTPCWLASSDDQCWYDASGPTVEIALAGLVEKLESVLIETARTHTVPATLARDENTVVHDDIGAMLRALRIGDHARPISMHDVVRQEIIPAIEALVATVQTCPQQARACTTRHRHHHQIVGYQDHAVVVDNRDYYGPAEAGGQHR